MSVAGAVIAAHPATASLAGGTVIAWASAEWGTTEVVRSIVLLLSVVVVMLFARLIVERVHEYRAGRLPSTKRLVFLDSGVILLALGETGRQASSLHDQLRWWIPLEGVGLASCIVGVAMLHSVFAHRRELEPNDPEV